MKFAPGDTKIQWIAMSLEGSDPRAALDRIEISGEVGQKISERLTPGSSLDDRREKQRTRESCRKAATFLIAVQEKLQVIAEELENSKSKSQAKIKQVTSKEKKFHIRVARASQATTHRPVFIFIIIPLR